LRFDKRDSFVGVIFKQVYNVDRLIAQ